MTEPAFQSCPAADPLPLPGRGLLLKGAVLAVMLQSGAASASETHLLDVYAGSSRSAQMKTVRSEGYELAGGEVVRFDDWYRPVIPDLTVLLLTELSADLGLIWGVSLGERGEKYRIDPAFHIGLTWQVRLSETATLSTSVQTMIGGRLRETSCSADYGVFGMAEVNCRLAASLLPPEETLDYLFDTPGHRETRVTIRFVQMF